MVEMKFLKFVNMHDTNVMMVRVDSIVYAYFNNNANTVTFNTNHPQGSLLRLTLIDDYQLKRLQSFLSPYESTIGSQICEYSVQCHEVINSTKDE